MAGALKDYRRAIIVGGERSFGKGTVQTLEPLPGGLGALKVTCENHTGVARARVFQWDGKQWNFVSDWIESDQKVVWPMVVEAAKKYAQEKSLPTDACSKAS